MKKMKHRLISVILAFTMICSNEIMVFAEANTEVSIIDEGICGDDLIWELTEDGCLIISGTGKMYDYGVQGNGEYISVPWETHMAEIVKLEIENGVTSIGKDAFSMCMGLTGELKIPESVTYIGDYAFSMCMGLTGELIIPEDVNYIGEGAFSYCRGLKGDLTIPEGVTEISDYAFELCSSLDGELTIPEGVTRIGEYAFSSCASLTGELKIPESVTHIEDNAFMGCSGFTDELRIPSNVTDIGYYAFDGCSGFTGDLLIPENVANINAYAFSGCNGLSGLQFVSPSTNVGNYAFSYCSNLSGVEIAEGMSRIPQGMFYGCNKLSSIEIPAGVMHIDAYAFAGCAIKEIVFPDTLKTLHENAFRDPYETHINNTQLGKIVFLGKDTDIPDDFNQSVDANAEIHGLIGSTAEIFAFNNGYVFNYYGEVDPDSIGNPFKDVEKSKWYYNSVLWSYYNGFLTGISNTKFAPNAQLTRGMFVTVLYRMEGRPSVREINIFPDVSRNKYYAKAITWAYGTGFIDGYSNGEFGPEDSITREQIAKILYLYAKYKDYDVMHFTNISDYADASSVSPYAKKYMEWAVAEGLIKGSNGKLNPKGNATRAEIAAILKRFVEKYEAASY